VCKSKGSMKPGGEVKARLRRLLFGAAVGSWWETTSFQRSASFVAGLTTLFLTLVRELSKPRARVRRTVLRVPCEHRGACML